MKILLVDMDSKIPNLALMKISAWHKLQGDETGFAVSDPDKVYISCIFKKNAGQAKGISTFYPDAEIDIGGSGVDLKKELPIDIEMMKPDYDLYPSTYSQGYTTRGCTRKCGFCIVPEKEGEIRTVQHPREFHDPRFDTCMIMDNNLFAASDEWQHDVLSWFIDNKIKMLSPQGWDARLLTKERWNLLNKVKHAGTIHFAWDNIEYQNHVERAIDIIKRSGISKRDLRVNISFYVLCGFALSNGKPRQIPFSPDDLYRCQTLKDLGVRAFVMPYHKKDKQINALARWANRPWLYCSIPFKNYRGAVKLKITKVERGISFKEEGDPQILINE
jgi:hypothetical protein